MRRHVGRHLLNLDLAENQLFRLLAVECVFSKDLSTWQRRNCLRQVGTCTGATIHTKNLWLKGDTMTMAQANIPNAVTGLSQTWPGTLHLLWDRARGFGIQGKKAVKIEGRHGIRRFLTLQPFRVLISVYLNSCIGPTTIPITEPQHY